MCPLAPTLHESQSHAQADELRMTNRVLIAASLQSQKQPLCMWHFRA